MNTCTFTLSCIALLSTLLGCSNQQVYEALQQRERAECQKLPPAQYEQCVQRTSESYDSYKRQRDEVQSKQ